MQKGKRKYRIVHESYLIEYLGITYPPGTWKTNVPLGKLKPIAGRALSEGELRYVSKPFVANADAVVVLKDKIVIIEAMVRHEPGALEDLIKYELLLRETPDYQQYSHLPIEKVLLTPLDLPFYSKLAARMGIKVVKYSPTWIWEYLHSYPRKEWRGKLSSVEFPEK